MTSTVDRSSSDDASNVEIWPPRRASNTFHRLPALTADSLPDDFGNALITAYLVNEGVRERDITPLDRLGYLAKRGTGEYAYHRVAVAAGIAMAECRLLHEGGRAHFMTRRFDRADDGTKVHMQTLCALGHLDFRLIGAHTTPSSSSWPPAWVSDPTPEPRSTAEWS